MKKFYIWIPIFFSFPALSKDFPSAGMRLQSPYSKTVFYGESIKIPIILTFLNMRGYKYWILPTGVTLEKVGGYCPSFNPTKEIYWQGTCFLNFVVSGYALGASIGWFVYWHTNGHTRHMKWNFNFPSPFFQVKVIPHPLSMLTPPEQSATANLPFFMDLKSTIRYYQENVQAGFSPIATVIPLEQDGLGFDKTTFSIKGTPTRIGKYVFKVGVDNQYSHAAPSEIIINVGINPKDKPVFKQNVVLNSALAEEYYQLNLLNLLDYDASFPKETFDKNRISFYIDENQFFPSWLELSQDRLFLQGKVPVADPQEIWQITLIARSNTGGNSEPITLLLPRAFDSDKKPDLLPIPLKGKAGESLFFDFSKQIIGNLEDPTLRLFLHKIEPEAPWLHLSSYNNIALEGNVPLDATGEVYSLGLRVANAAGGFSKPYVFILNIDTNEQMRPRFKAANPILPILYPGQAYFYDFVANKDVYPDFEDSPYRIQLVDTCSGIKNPNWLQLINNQLIAEQVPMTISQSTKFCIQISNKEGGTSEPLSFTLFSMN